MTTSYLKKKAYYEVNGFFVFPSESVQFLLMTDDQRFHQQIANVFPYITLTHGFAKDIQFSVLYTFTLH